MPKFKTLFSVALFFLTLSSVFGQTTRARYVKATATGMMDGTTWANAMTLQAAIDGFTAGDVLYLMSGSYTPTAKKADGTAVGMGEERDATYVLPSGILIYGGFAGTETGSDAAAVLAARTLASIATTNETIIEGNRGMSAVNTDNIKSLFTLADNARVTLNGLTVGRGKSTTTNGAGLLAGESVRLTIQWCRFIGNESHTGGAIYKNFDGTLTVTNSHFEDNAATSRGGGAIFAGDGTSTFTASTFTGNSAARRGLALLIDDSGVGTVERCFFLENSGTSGQARGALGTIDGTELEVFSSLFAGNTAPSAAAIFSDGSATLTNCTIYGNTSSLSRWLGNSHRQQQHRHGDIQQYHLWECDDVNSIGDIL